ncbi:MAG: hypothetical protein ACRDRH_09885 [Pseudonocardia sp.]
MPLDVGDVAQAVPAQEGKLPAPVARQELADEADVSPAVRLASDRSTATSCATPRSSKGST